MQIPRSERGTDREGGNEEHERRGEQATDKYRRTEGTGTGANTEKWSKCEHEKENMRDRARGSEAGRGVCAGYSWQRDSQSQMPV